MWVYAIVQTVRPREAESKYRLNLSIRRDIYFWLSESHKLIFTYKGYKGSHPVFSSLEMWVEKSSRETEKFSNDFSIYQYILQTLTVNLDDFLQLTWKKIVSSLDIM